MRLLEKPLPLQLRDDYASMGSDCGISLRIADIRKIASQIKVTEMYVDIKGEKKRKTGEKQMLNAERK